MSNSYPLVTIVTPSFNQGSFIESTINSILRQDYPNIEYIVIDGGSTDGTLDILRKYQDRLTWISEADKGQSDAVNKGWKRARGEFLSWLNSDDLAAPNAVSTSIRALLDHPNMVMTFGACTDIDANGCELGTWELREFDYRRLAGHPDWVSSPMMMIRHRALEAVGMLDINLHYAMDYDFFVRLAKYGPIEYLPKHLSFFRRHTAAKSSKGWEAHKREILSVNAHYGGESHQQLLRRYWAGLIRRRMKSLLRIPAHQ